MYQFNKNKVNDAILISSDSDEDVKENKQESKRTNYTPKEIRESSTNLRFH